MNLVDVDDVKVVTCFFFPRFFDAPISVWCTMYPNNSEHRPYLSERQLVVFVYRFFRKTGMILPKWLFWGKLCCIFSIVFVVVFVSSSSVSIVCSNFPK